MPEGDTVYALARRLESALDDRVLTHGELRVPAHATDDLAGRTVLAHVTHGKHLLTRLSGGLTLHTHLRMSGSWTISAAGRWLPRTVMPDVRVVLRTEGPAAYGVLLPVVELLRTRDESSATGHLGPDPLRDDWDIDEAVRRMTAEQDRPLVAALLDQRCVAGFGNLWANGTVLPARPQSVDARRRGGRPRTAQSRRQGDSSLGEGSRCHAGDDGTPPQGGDALGGGPCGQAVPALRDDGAGRRRGGGRSGAAPDLVVSQLPARARPGLTSLLRCGDVAFPSCASLRVRLIPPRR